jgi:hypothetical protein
MKLEFSWRILEKNTQISNFANVSLFWTDLFNDDGQIDRHDESRIVAFRRFANAPKICSEKNSGLNFILVFFLNRSNK